jgi:hypothetical protein
VTGKTKLALMETVAWVAIVASIVAIAVPKRAEMQRMREAQRVIADVETVREAVFSFYSDSAYFPTQTNEEIPESLMPYLPLTFQRVHAYGTLQYRNWPVGPAYRDSSAANIVGVTVTTPDARIGAAAASRQLRLAQFAVENRYTFIYFGK